MFRTSCLILLALIVVVVVTAPDAANSIPAFARKYGLSCTTCHVAPPKLKEYGDEFAANGFQLPDEEEPVRAYQNVGDDLLLLQRDFPIAVRFDSYARYLPDNDDSDNDFQSPFGVKLMSGGSIASDIGYYFYFYMNEAGEVAGVEDAYVHFNNIRGTNFDLMVGQFQISDPLFKRELRLTYEDYVFYTTRIGKSRVNLTYDRGIIMTYGFKTGTDIVVEVINGNGIGEAQNDLFDDNSFKNVFGKVSQAIPMGTVGLFGYTGKENHEDYPDIRNKFLMWGPDFTVGTEMVEVSGQYLRRSDDNPDFAAVKPDEMISEGYIGKVVVNPFPEDSRLFGIVLYNKVSSDYPGVAYESITVNSNYLLRRNLRLLAEYTRDIEREVNTATIGFMAAF